MQPQVIVPSFDDDFSKTVQQLENGQTCATAWPVIQVDEEYFILTIIDAQLLEQSITEEKRHLCDQMNVKVDGKKKTYYFETSKVFEGYKKLGL